MAQQAVHALAVSHRVHRFGVLRDPVRLPAAMQRGAGHDQERIRFPHMHDLVPAQGRGTLSCPHYLHALRIELNPVLDLPRLEAEGQAQSG